MSKKCPNCNGDLEFKGNVYKCPFCGSTFPATDAETRSTETNASKTLLRADSSIPPLAGEDIYDMSIKGVAVINCLDFGFAGSGFLFDEKGYIITNAHVITNNTDKESQRIEVMLAGRRYKASVVCRGRPNKFDVAMLKIDRPTGANKLTIGDSNKVKNGESVYAIGNSFGEGLCITKGIVSDKDRIIFDYHAIMADVAINPGNSGGPLIDVDGKVIAICVAGVTEAEGMNYFIPINDIVAVVTKYIK